jgi:predicted transcriptional regulator of viral defense system
MQAQSNSPNMKGLGARERLILGYLASTERPTVTAGEIVDHFRVSRAAANLLLSRLAKKGWLHRLRRGRYSIVPLSSRSLQPVIESPLAAAMELFSPCYISGWSAAEQWDLTDQVSNAVVVYTSGFQRRTTQVLGGVTYRIRRIPKAQMFGTTQVWIGRTQVQIADPHRTLVDILDAPELGGGGRQAFDIVRAYFRSKQADPDRVLEYAAKLGRGAVFKRLGFAAELFTKPSEQWVRKCQSHLSAGIALLDPAGPRQGRIDTRWRVRLNIPVGPSD